MRQEQGFTVIEVLVSALILVFLFAVAYTVLESSVGQWLHGEQKTDSQQNVRIVLDRLTREARQAKEYLEPGTQPGGIEYIEFIDIWDRTVRYVFDPDKEEITRYVDGSRYDVVGYGITAVDFSLSNQDKILSVTVTSGSFTSSSQAGIRVIEN